MTTMVGLRSAWLLLLSMLACAHAGVAADQALRAADVRPGQHLGVYYRRQAPAITVQERGAGRYALGAGQDELLRAVAGLDTSAMVAAHFEPAFAGLFHLSLERLPASAVAPGDDEDMAEAYRAAAVKRKLDALVVVDVEPLLEVGESAIARLRVGVKMRRSEDDRMIWRDSVEARAVVSRTDDLRRAFEGTAAAAVQRLFGGRGVRPGPPPEPERMALSASCDQVEDQRRYACTQVIGFSQTMNWFGTPRTSYFEGNPGIDDDRWQLLWRGGAAIENWADPDFEGYDPSAQGTNLLSKCTESSDAPDRILLTVSSNIRFSDSTSEELAATIRRALTTLRTRYPSVHSILLQPVVGGPEHCDVGAVENHPRIVAAIGLVTASGEAVPGLSPLAPSCKDFKDEKGHLKSKARRQISRQIAACYGSS